MQKQNSKLNIVAMIPARGGSKGIKNKNIRPVGNKPLIQYTFDSVKSSKLISRAVLSTDSREIMDLARQNEIEIPFTRPVELAIDTTCMVDVMEHCVEWLEKNEGYKTDILVILYPTSPFRSGQQIDEAIEIFIESDADCLISVSAQKHHPYWSLNINEEKRLSHFFGNDHLYYRRQDMPITYDQNGAIYIVPAENISRLDKRSMTENTLAYVMDEKSGINIDTELDLILADALIKIR